MEQRYENIHFHSRVNIISIISWYLFYHLQPLNISVANKQKNKNLSLPLHQFQTPNELKTGRTY